MSTPPPHLTALEVRLWEAYRRGERLDLSTGTAADDDPRTGVPWGADRTIRASVLARLLLQPPEAEPGHMTALRLTGALVTGRLELGGGRMDVYISVIRCRFENPIILNVASSTTIFANECVIPAFQGRNLRIDGDLSLQRCEIPGGILILDARIDNDLRVHDCVVGPGGHDRAVYANGLQVGADATFDRSVFTGQVSLHGARFGGNARFSGTRIGRPGEAALDLGRVYVEHSLFLTQGFHVSGSIRINDARVGDAIVLAGGTACTNPDEQLTLWRVTARGLHLALTTPPLGRIVLNGASVGILTDTPDTWPPPGNLEIAELTYTTRRAAAPAGVADRIAWVERGTAEYAPQPYDQLASVYRSAGEDDEARAVLLAKQRRRRETLSIPGRLWGRVQDVAIGYGYRPARAFGWLVALIAVGTVVFAANRPAPLKPDESPHWNPFWYTLDLLLPVVTLGQDNAWKPAGATQWLAYTLILLGWVLAGAAAAGATRVLNRA
ncbi:pentapeptide repeat-containing protein [Embleya sp. NBC_00896]|uniref:pentapeptide repeat-containing protein n=1 Tax=Embleya sp. NBC_00896 TaxID=2975961 RepID=UPI00386FB4A8|nr:pentapeptide repeat-containing protein [Embleya sp. NBC_00896]